MKKIYREKDPSLPNLEISQVKNQIPRFLSQQSQLHKFDLSRLCIEFGSYGPTKLKDHDLKSTLLN